MTDEQFPVSVYGVPIPKIIYGTAWKKDRTAGLVEQALRLGFRGIDTAGQPKHYDEAGVGRGLAAYFARGFNREEIYLQSKFTPADGQDPARMPYDPNAGLSKQVLQSFNSTLKNLGTDYLDCLVLHSPLPNEREQMEVWQSMEAIFDEGFVKQLGISNCYRLTLLERLYDKTRIKPAVVQNRFYANTGYDRDIRVFCRKQSIYYQSFWTLTANPGVLAHDTLQDLASRTGRSPAQVFFRFLTQIGIIPLTGTTSEDHMRQDLAIFDFELSDKDRDAVGRLL
ncbi:MAG: aldo/keto reductase [Methylococcaceae bacterium]|nr:aldo/keto reductase [Methylococcaceae bacterium]